MGKVLFKFSFVFMHVCGAIAFYLRFNVRSKVDENLFSVSDN